MKKQKIRKINNIRKKINKGRAINRNILKVSVFVSIVFFALMVYLCCFLTFDASSVINNSYNRRSDTLTQTVKRGSILASDDSVLAYSEIDSNGEENRIYPYGRVFAHVVGFNVYGGLGLESSYNYYLLTSHTDMFQKIADEFKQEKSPGDSIKTTLDTDLQEFVYDILNFDGAIVCMNPDTGEIYAMVSKPDFDPNYISDDWDSIVSDESNSCLLNRTCQGLYTPGSTFKIFTLYEYYLENKDDISSFKYDCSGSINVGDTSISCINNTAHGEESIEEAFANSCNCAFSYITAGLNIDSLKETAENLLFDTDLPVDINSYKSIFSLTASDSEFDIMATGIGQGDTLCSPMHLAMVIAAIANDGICMKPYLVSGIQNSSGDTIKTFRSEQYKTLFSQEEAAFLKSCLRKVITEGTSTILYPGNFVAYGKTGTAQVEDSINGEYDHSWFVGWAENNENKLAVSIIIENMEEASTYASYLAKEIFDHYFNY